MATLVVGGGIAVVLVAGFMVLTLAGRATDSYVLFVSGPLVTTIVGGLLNRRVAAVERVAADALAVATDSVPASVVVDVARAAGAGGGRHAEPAPAAGLFAGPRRAAD